MLKKYPAVAPFLLPVLVLGVVLLVGCAAVNPQVRTQPDENSSLLFGYFDMTGSGDILSGVHLNQDEKVGIVYRSSAMKTYRDGLFFMQDLPPMRYVIPFFYAGNTLYSFRPDEEDAFQLPPDTLAFVGAYKYHDPKKGGILTTRKFDLIETDSPSEVEILKMLLERVEGDRWKMKINARLKALGQ